MKRRTFIAAAAAAPVILPRTVFGANNKLNIAFIGMGGQIQGHVKNALQLGHNVVAFCDVDPNQIAGSQNRHKAKAGNIKAYADYRELLEKEKTLEAVVVATPDHWHAPVTIHSCLAGKDVYVEKPCSHNVSEGRLSVNAARKYKRIVQHGTNLRSAPHYKKAWQLVKEGVIGTPMMVKAINNQRRGRLPEREDSPVPSGVNYDLWLGPAPNRPFNRNHFHSSWHWMWNYGTGDLGNDGVHQIDLGRWALGLKAPNAVSCSGAKLGSRGDAQQTPDSMVVTWEYDELLYVFEQRDFTPYRQQGHRLDNDNIIFGDKGYLMVDRDGYRVFYKNEAGPSFEEKWNDSPAHYQNFIDCVKSREQEKLVADIEEGHYSAMLCHLGNIAYRTGRRLEFDPKSETFVGDEQANQLLSREYRKGYELPTI